MGKNEQSQGNSTIVVFVKLQRTQYEVIRNVERSVYEVQNEVCLVKSWICSVTRIEIHCSAFVSDVTCRKFGILEGSID